MAIHSGHSSAYPIDLLFLFPKNSPEDIPIVKILHENLEAREVISTVGGLEALIFATKDPQRPGAPF